MALINCPECNNQISDKATICVHCGCPNEFFIDKTNNNSLITKKTVRKSNTRLKSRRMKLPNGFGSIKKMGGNRRKPYFAFPPVRKSEMDDNGRFPTKKSLGSFKTYQEAYECLMNYSKIPFDEKYARATFKELYEEYEKSDEYNNLKASTKTARASAYKYCESLYELPVRNITKKHCTDILDSIDKSASTKKNVLTCMKTISTIAMDMNLISKDFTFNISIEAEKAKLERKVFTDKEFNILWNNKDTWQCKVILMLIYSGLRINELLKNDVKNVDLENKTIYVPIEISKNKTSERTIPIHDDVLEFYEYFVTNAIKFKKDKLMTKDNGTVVSYYNFSSRDLLLINEILGEEHKFHDTRHTFATKGVKSGIEEIYMQKILGHAPKSMLMKTYTHISVDDLRKELHKIKFYE